MKSVCVFCGSRTGRPEHEAAARALGQAIARSGRTLVYGGASVGLMGVCADAALAEGGEVVGVLPHGLFAREIAHGGLTRLETVGSLHERKLKMHALSDAFIALPGGYGTLDELFETITWRQLGIHGKPIGLLEVDGYFSHLLRFIANARELGFVPETGLFTVESDPDRLLTLLESDAGGPIP
jgi:uncharacterized protein (TIGR00730 family)